MSLMDTSAPIPMIGCAKRMLESADGTRVDKPWGYELRWAITDRYVGKVLHINRGAALSLQYHERKDETVLVAEGEMDFELDDDQGRLVTRRMCPGDAVRVLPGRRHRMIAVEDCQVFEVSTPELDDVVRLADRYGRAGS